MPKFQISLVLIFLSLLLLDTTSADTLYLKNGRVAEGIITREDKNGVELNLGGGSVIFTMGEIARVERSTQEDADALMAKWEKNKQAAQKMNAVAEEQRKKAMDEWRVRYAEEEALRKADERERKKMDANTRRAEVYVDKTGHLLVNVVINDDVRASMVIDTGAPTVLLTATIAQQLGYSLEHMGKVEEVSVLNGKHRAAPVMLKNVMVGEASEPNVPAFVLLDDNKQITEACKGGLLGLSFLERFHVSLDQKNGLLLLRKDQ